MLKIKFPPIRVHCWGGLGSQLFALALIEDLRQDLPKRSIKLILHTGGVTKRLSEIDSIAGEIKIEYKDDFRPKQTKDSKITLSSRKQSIKNQLGKAFNYFGFIAKANSSKQYLALRPWVLSTRGHYSRREISSKSIKSIASRLESACQISREISQNHSLAVQYRLGDLLTLGEKNPVSAQLITAECKNLIEENNISDLWLYSDSPSIASKNLNDLGANVKIHVQDVTTIQVIIDSINTDLFIGTSSKISFWITLLRFHLGKNSPGSLPKGNEQNIIPLFKFGTDLSAIKYY